MGTVKKVNEWLVPQSIVVGVGATMALMIVPVIRNAIVSATSKVGSMIGLK